jgi:hypothetical protein
MSFNVSFTTANAALISTLISVSSLFTTDNAKTNNFDSVFLYAIETKGVYTFAYSTYEGGTDLGMNIWQHQASLVTGILFRAHEISLDTDPVAQMGADIETVVDEILSNFLPENTLGGAVLSARIAGIGPPELWNHRDSDVDYIEIVYTVSMEQDMEPC